MKDRWRESPAYDAETLAPWPQRQLFHCQCWKHIERETAFSPANTYEISEHDAYPPTKVKSFPCLDQFYAMAFAQLAMVAPLRSTRSTIVPGRQMLPSSEPTRLTPAPRVKSAMSAIKPARIGSGGSLSSLNFDKKNEGLSAQPTRNDTSPRAFAAPPTVRTAGSRIRKAITSTENMKTPAHVHRSRDVQPFQESVT